MKFPTFLIVSVILLSSVSKTEGSQCHSNDMNTTPVGSSPTFAKCDLDASTKVGICSCYMGYQNNWLEAESLSVCEAVYGIDFNEKTGYCSQFTVKETNKINVQRFTAYANSFVSVCKKDIVMNRSKPPSSSDLSFHVQIDFNNLAMGIREIGNGLMAVGEGFADVMSGMRAVISGAAQVYGVLISAIPFN